MRRIEISKFIFYAICTIGLLGLSFGFGLYSASKKTIVYKIVLSLKETVKQSFSLVFEEATTLTKSDPKHFLQPARYPGAGVTVNEFGDSEEDLVLMSGFFHDGNELRLIKRNGTLVARWPLSFSKIFPDASHLKHSPLRGPPQTDWNIDTHGALALPDGSVVFNFEYGGLVKLDRCGNILWKVARPTHHSVEQSESGGFWVPGQRYVLSAGESPFPPFEPPLKEDTILKVSEAGEVLTELSVPKLFYDNGLVALLTGTGHWFKPKAEWDQEILHLNKISELPSSIANDFNMFEAGDLALSMREQNLVMVISPNTGRIKWWRVGPWLRQHDPEFTAGGKMIVFNNNVFANFDISRLSNPNAAYPSNIIEIDIASDEHRVLYGGRKGQELFSILRGKVEATPTKGLLVTEFEGGRVFQTNAAGRIVWEYINRFDSSRVAEITEARVYPRSYFQVPDWSCER